MPALISITLLFAAGIVTSHHLPFSWWLMLAVAALVFGFLVAMRNNRKAVSIIILLLAFLAGALRLALLDVHLDELELYVDKVITVEGTVVREAEPAMAGTSYVLAVRLAGDTKLQPLKGRVLLRDLRPEGETYYYGDLVRVRGKLVRPQGAANFGQFDYRAYLERRGIHNQMAVFEEGSIEKIAGDTGNPILNHIFEVRRRYVKVADILPPTEAALLRALTLGERYMISPEIVDLFTASGTVHLMAVSGVHVGLVAALVLGLGRLLRFPFLLQGILTALTISLYVIWTGFTPSAIRAGIMFMLGLLGLATGRPKNSLVALAAAALILLIANPLNLFDMGFQLSFAATLGILYFGSQLIVSDSKWRRWCTPVIVSLAAQACTWPLTAYYFSGVSLVGFLASVAAIPVASLALTFGLIGLVIGAWYLPAGKILLGVAGMALVVLTSLARFFARLPWAFVYIRRPSVVFIAIYYLAIFTAPYFLRAGSGKIRLRRWLFVGLTLVLLVVSWRGPGSSTLIVDFLAVGQGDAILIRSPSGQAALIDAGPRLSMEKSVWDAGEKILLPYLRAQGVHRLELVFFTHGDMDHTGGGAAIISGVPVGAVIAPANFDGIGADLIRGELEQRGVPLYNGTRGLRVDLGAGVEVMVLSPPVETIVPMT